MSDKKNINTAFVIGIIFSILVFFSVMALYPDVFNIKTNSGKFLTDYYQNKPISIEGYEFGISSGKSMNPSIPDKSIEILDYNYKSLKVGDIVTFKNPENEEELLGHRIIKIRENNFKFEYLVRGDTDRIGKDKIWITEEFIEAKVVGVLF